MTGTVVRFPKTRTSPLEREIARVSQAFRDDPDLATRQCLARSVHQYLLEITERHGERAGALGYVIGGSSGTSKHRRRFEWDAEREPDRDFDTDNLHKNAGEWLAVLRRCAEKLDRDEADLLLEAFAGTRHVPVDAPEPAIKAAQWMAAFGDLMKQVQASLVQVTNLPSLYDYLAASLLELDESGEWCVADEPIAYRVDDRLRYDPSLLGALPHAPLIRGLEWGVRIEGGTKLAEWRVLLDALEADPNIGGARPDEEVGLFLEVRYGISFVAGRNGAPQLALFGWPVAHLEIFGLIKSSRLWAASAVDTSPAREAAWAILEKRWGKGGIGPLDMLTFAPLGTARFDRWAAKIFDPVAELRSDTDRCWDPLATSAEGEASHFPTAAPRGTLAAVIERNLLYAEPMSTQDRRIDRILLEDVRRLSAKLDAFRRQEDKIAAAARREFIASLRQNGKKS